MEAVNNLYVNSEKTWTEKHGSHAKEVTKTTSNIREGSAFSDVVDPEIKSAKGSEQKAKKDTSSNQSYTIKESIKRQKHYKQRRFMELRKSQICSGFGSVI